MTTTSNNSLNGCQSSENTSTKHVFKLKKLLITLECSDTILNSK